MECNELHSWNLTPGEAVQLQKELRGQLRIQSLEKPANIVAGADISFNLGSSTVYAGFVLMEVQSLKVIETATAVTEVTFPYIPGLLSFREIPPLLEAWRKIKIAPDVVVLDGQGIAHPRRMGIAAHFGLWINRPTVGCAKSLLIGNYGNLADPVGSFALLKDHGETIGAALRTKKNCHPVFISPGHRMSLEDSLRLLTDLNGGYRIPEPTRQAHLLVNELRRGHA